MNKKISCEKDKSILINFEINRYLNNIDLSKSPIGFQYISSEIEFENIDDEKFNKHCKFTYGAIQVDIEQSIIKFGWLLSSEIICGNKYLAYRIVNCIDEHIMSESPKGEIQMLEIEFK